MLAQKTVRHALVLIAHASLYHSTQSKKPQCIWCVATTKHFELIFLYHHFAPFFYTAGGMVEVQIVRSLKSPYTLRATFIEQGPIPGQPGVILGFSLN